MKVLFISLGCDKNLVDSEFMLGKFARNEFTFTDDETEADIIVINTCCFIHDAKEESIQTILEMARYRTEGSCRALIVCGCLAQRYQEEIRQEIPEVDAVLGTNSTECILEAVQKVLEGETYENYRPLTDIEQHEAKRSVTTGGHYAHLKIAEGCDKRCTYCIIPSIRGPYRSVPMEDLLAQARELADAGVKELILVAQETTLYGVDLYGKKSLHLLLNELNKIPGIYWIRLMYCYPEEIYDELIGESKDTKDADRFEEVRRIEAMSLEEKFAFFQSELSKCIRCNACRNVCPACSCRKCVFDSTKFDSTQKANVDSFEEKMFHIIRAFHVAGRCTDCGECSRVCPQGIPLHLFNRKFIKDIDELYGEYQAGEDAEALAPLTDFTFDDAEPSIVGKRG